MENNNSRRKTVKSSKACAATLKPKLNRSSNAGYTKSANTQPPNTQPPNTTGAAAGTNIGAAPANYNCSYDPVLWNLYSNQYAANQYYANMYGAASSFPSTGGCWNSPLAAAQQTVVAPVSSKMANLKQAPASSTKKQKKKTNDASVFDENNELKDRIAELEAELGLNTKPCMGKKSSNENACGDNIKPDLCSSVGTPIKKDPSALPKMETPIKDLNKFDRRWIEQYEELVAYQDTHGHNMVPAAFGKLGRWVSRQRQEYKKGKLSAERIKELEKIDFVWVAM